MCATRRGRTEVYSYRSDFEWQRRMSQEPRMLHPELHDDQANPDGANLQHAEGASKPLRSRSGEAQPRGADFHGSRPVNQSEAAKRFMAAPEHAKMHDERLWDLREKRDRQMHGIPEWE